MAGIIIRFLVVHDTRKPDDTIPPGVREMRYVYGNLRELFGNGSMRYIERRDFYNPNAMQLQIEQRTGVRMFYCDDTKAGILKNHLFPSLYFTTMLPHANFEYHRL